MHSFFHFTIYEKPKMNFFFFSFVGKNEAAAWENSNLQNKTKRKNEEEKQEI